MNVPRRNHPNDYYLDVAQIVLTEHKLKMPSPIHSPIPNHPNQMYSPANLPLVLEIQGVELSPYFAVNGNAQIQFLDFTLQIPEQDEEEQSCSNMNIIEEQSIEESEQISDQSDGEVNNESYQQYSALEYISGLPSSKLNLHYFKTSLNELKRKKSPQFQIKQFLFDYLTPQNLQNVNIESISLNSLIKMAQHNLRPFGSISWLQRKAKVLKFKGKKSRRSWNKKINYDCRKKVADSRLRVKGKFVTKQQACNILGVEQTSQDNIKQLLQLKFHNSK